MLRPMDEPSWKPFDRATNGKLVVPEQAGAAAVEPSPWGRLNSGCPRLFYTPFISRAPAALLIAADCVVADDATLAESGPSLCHAMRLLGLPMLSLAPRPLGRGFGN
jgi:hypothetical protein